MIDLGGIIPAIVTPMLDEERLDLAAIEPYVEWLIGTGCLGLAVNVDTGEGPHLTRDERAAVLERVVSVAKGRVRVVAGVGGPSTADGVANARIARDAGADALLVFPIAAFLSQPLRTDIVVAYHRAIADATGMPMVLFQLQPMLGGVHYTPEVLDGLLAIPQVVAIKEASFDPLRWLALKAHLDAADRRITLLTGNDNFIAESFLLGAQGALLGFATLLTRQHVELQAAAEAGDIVTARELGARIQRLADVIFAPPVADYRARTKEALAMMGVIPSAVTRPPLLPIDDAGRARVRSALVAAGLLAG
ncbi:MAG: dihydrodipicolinate synthase family protein [Chloroflexota bacterium]